MTYVFGQSDSKTRTVYQRQVFKFRFMANVASFVSLDLGGARLGGDKIYFGAACISLRHEIMKSHIR